MPGKILARRVMQHVDATRPLAAQMAAFRLCAGVVWIALVSRYVLGEELTTQKLVGFGIMMVAMVLVGSAGPSNLEDSPEGSQ